MSVPSTKTSERTLRSLLAADDVRLTLARLLTGTWGDSAATYADESATLSSLISAGIGQALDAASELTIASGAITPTQPAHTVDTEADAATDNLTTISTATGVLFLRQESPSRDVTLVHGTAADAISTPDAATLAMSDYGWVTLYRETTSDAWTVVASFSAGGGGETNTASNAGGAGVGVFDGKVGVDLEMRNLVGATGIDVALDAGNKEIDLSVTAGGIDTTQLADEGVTLAKLAHIATSRILGRVTAATGDVEVLTAANVFTILGITAFAQTLLDDVDASTARTTLGVDAAGTDNSTDVTLAGTPDYLTIAGQVITRGLIDLAADVTGVLPTANIADEAVTLAKLAHIATASLLGRNTAATGDVEVIAQASSGEKTAGTETGLRGFSPQDIHDMIDTHAGAGGGDVTKTGTAANDQLAVWVNDGSIEGTSALTFVANVLGIAASGALAFNGTNILADSAGTMTLSNVDALDATTKATIEAAITALTNLVTVGTLTTGNATAIVDAASTSAAGKVELAVASEVDTGTSDLLAVTPDALADSDQGRQPVGMAVFESDASCTAGDGKVGMHIPEKMHGWSAVRAAISVHTAGSGGSMTVTFRRRRSGADTDMNSTPVTLTAGTTANITSFSAAGLETDDVIYVDVDTVHSTTPALGLSVCIECRAVA